MATDQKARGSNPLSFAKATDFCLPLFLLSRSSLHSMQQASPVNPYGLTLHCVSLFRRFAPYDPLSFAKATDKSLPLFLLSRSSLHSVQQASPVNPCGKTTSKAEKALAFFRRAQMTQSNIKKKRERGYPSPDKTLAFCQKRTSTLPYRKMRSRPRLRSGFTQRPCFRVSSSCTLYEVFGNFAWRSAPPRKRVTQSEKAPDCETESVPAFRLSVDSLLHCNKGNGNGGNSVRKGVSFTPPTAGFLLAICGALPCYRARELPSHSLQAAPRGHKNIRR